MADDSKAEQWRWKLLPAMRGALVIMALFFFAASLLQYRQVYQDLRMPSDSSLGVDGSGPASTQEAFSSARFRTMVALENRALNLRYRQLNATLLLRAWTRYTGFLVGMVLALTGAFFILGRLQEGTTHLTGEGAGAKFDLASESPGLVLAVLGTVLMVLTIWVRFDMDVADKPVYILPWGLVRAETGYPVGDLPDPAAKLKPVVDDFPSPPPGASSVPVHHAPR